MLCNSEVRMTKIAWNAAIVLQHAMHELRVRVEVEVEVEVEVGWGYYPHPP